MRYGDIISTAVAPHFIQTGCSKLAIVGLLGFHMRPAAAQSDSCCDAYSELFAQGQPLLWLAGGAEGRLGKWKWGWADGNLTASTATNFVCSRITAEETTPPCGVWLKIAPIAINRVADRRPLACHACSASSHCLFSALPSPLLSKCGQFDAILSLYHFIIL
jgi:hypothetical protein